MFLVVCNLEHVHAQGYGILAHPACYEHAVHIHPDSPAGGFLRVNQTVEIQLLDVDQGKKSIAAVCIYYVRMLK